MGYCVPKTLFPLNTGRSQGPVHEAKRDMSQGYLVGSSLSYTNCVVGSVIVSTVTSLW